MPYTKFLLSLQRFRLPKDHKGACCVDLGTGVLEDGIHLASRLAGPRNHSAFAAEYLRLKREYPNMCWHGMFSLLKARTGLIKMGGRFIAPHWRWLCYWETCYGYREYVPLEELEDQVVDWLVKPRDLGGEIGVSEYTGRIYDEVRIFLSEEWTMPRDRPTIAEYVAGGAWMRGKAGTGAKTGVLVEGKMVKTRAFKPVEAVRYSNSEIAADLCTWGRDVMIVMEKSEGGKVRPVVKYGNRGNRQMDYLSNTVERGLYGTTTTTLFAGSAGNEKIDLELLEITRNKAYFKVPLDQSAFDAHQSRDTIVATFAAIGDFFREQLKPDDDFWRVWDPLFRTVCDAGADVVLGNKRWDWQNGVPSGWRWTALLDTLLNIASFRVIRKHLELTHNRPIEVASHVSQGDDVFFATRDLEAIGLILEAYKNTGYEVHPQKTYISRVRGEFLRRSYEEHGVIGFVMRTLVSLRFRNPIIPIDICPPARLYSRLALWHLGVLRGCDELASMQCYLEDAVQAGVAREDAADFALTPNSVGGAGLYLCGEGSRLLKQAGSGRWLRFNADKPGLTIAPVLGKWKERLLPYEKLLSHEDKDAINRSLALGWGLREAQITGKVTWEWTEVKKIRPRYCNSVYLAPDMKDAWELTGIGTAYRHAL